MSNAHFAKGGALRRSAFVLLLCCVTSVAHAQRITSFAIATGAAAQDDARPTAAFMLSAGVHYAVPWLTLVQRSVADTETETDGTIRDASLALLPAWEPLQGRVLLAAGPSLHSLHRDHVFGPDESETRIAATGVAGLRLPIAGPGVAIELLARGDWLDPQPLYTVLFGVRVRPGLRNTLMLGEPMTPTQVAAHHAVWNDVLMQLILLQQSLESFTRIRELPNGIELEFDQSQITLYDDVARVGRVLAAADPPVTVTVFAPNAGRTGAALTAGSFPAERLRLSRDVRVFLRVEH